MARNVDVEDRDEVVKRVKGMISDTERARENDSRKRFEQSIDIALESGDLDSVPPVVVGFSEEKPTI